MIRPSPRSTRTAILLPHSTRFRSHHVECRRGVAWTRRCQFSGPHRIRAAHFFDLACAAGARAAQRSRNAGGTARGIQYDDERDTLDLGWRDRRLWRIANAERDDLFLA